MIVQPIIKGQCQCCIDENVVINNCANEKCDYNMCDKCYYIYYSKNIKCPACRTIVEKDFLDLNVNTYSDNEENEEVNEPESPVNETSGIRNIFNNICREFEIPINAIHNLSIKKIIKFLIKHILSLVLLLLLGRFVYLFTIITILPETDTELYYFHNNFKDFILTSIIGIIYLIGWLMVVFIINAICCACCNNDNDDYN